MLIKKDDIGHNKTGSVERATSKHDLRHQTKNNVEKLYDDFINAIQQQEAPIKLDVFSDEKNDQPSISSVTEVESVAGERTECNDLNNTEKYEYSPSGLDILKLFIADIPDRQEKPEAANMENDDNGELPYLKAKDSVRGDEKIDKMQNDFLLKREIQTDKKIIIGGVGLIDRSRYEATNIGSALIDRLKDISRPVGELVKIVPLADIEETSKLKALDESLISETLKEKIFTLTPVKTLFAKNNDISAEKFQKKDPQRNEFLKQTELQNKIDNVYANGVRSGKDEIDALIEGESFVEQTRTLSIDGGVATESKATPVNGFAEKFAKVIEEVIKPAASQETSAPKQPTVIPATPVMIKKIKLELHPEHLGKLDIEVRLDGNKLQIIILPSTKAAEEILSHDQDEVKKILEKSGFELGESAITISYRTAETIQKSAENGELNNNEQRQSNQIIRDQTNQDGSFSQPSPEHQEQSNTPRQNRFIKQNNERLSGEESQQAHLSNRSTGVFV